MLIGKSKLDRRRAAKQRLGGGRPIIPNSNGNGERERKPESKFWVVS